jgi:hypothetical protein
MWAVLGVVVRVSSPSSSSGHYPLVFGLAAASFCRWVGVLIRIWWCFVLLGEDVVFLPAEVVVLARFWRLGVVLVLVAEVMNGCGGVCSCPWFFVLESSKGLGA